MSTEPPGALPRSAVPICPEAWAKAGAILGGRYRVEALEAGELGPQTITAPAVDLARGRVAVSVFRAARGDALEEASRALSFALSAKALQSPHAVRVLDAALLDERSIFIVTEAWDGCALGELVRRSGPLPVIEAVELIAGASMAVAEAHALGLCHGDLTPARLFASPRGGGRLSIKVAGLGAPCPLTVDLWAYFFRAPEARLVSGSVSPRADLFSLGATLFYLLTGRLPLAEDAEPVGVLHGAPAELHALRPAASVSLGRVVLRCMAEDPAARYESALDLLQALRFFLPQTSDLGAEIAALEVSARTPQPPPPPRRPSEELPPGWKQGAPWLRAVAILAVVGFAAFTGLSFSVARRADIESALSPFRSLFADDLRLPERPQGRDPIRR